MPTFHDGHPAPDTHAVPVHPQKFHDGQHVTYQPIGGSPEQGVITEAYAVPTGSFVRYGQAVHSLLTDHRDLTVDQVAEEIVLEAAQNALAACAELTKLLDALTVQTTPGEWTEASWLLRGAATAHRGHIAAITLRLDEAILGTMPLLTWAESGRAILPDGRRG